MSQAENDECRLWMLKDESLDGTIDKLTRLLSCKDMCTASNAALVLARYVVHAVFHLCEQKIHHYADAVLMQQ